MAAVAPLPCSGTCWNWGRNRRTCTGKSVRAAGDARIDRLYIAGNFATAVADGAMDRQMNADRIFCGTKAAIIEQLNHDLQAGDLILVKGSRGMAMEDGGRGYRRLGRSANRSTKARYPQMIYHLLYPLHTTFAAFNVFRYITFRTIYASLTAFLICFLLGPWVIRRLSLMQVGQYIREDGPKDHHKKAGTPTMGGVLIIFAVAGSTLLWTDLTNRYVWIALLATLGFGAIGFADDYLMQVKKRNLGLTARQKLLLQVLLALLVGLLAYMVPEFSTKLSVPFFKRLTPDPGWGYIFFAALVIVGASNAVNLTDGLDGLAIGPVIIAAVTYMIFAYVAGHARIADYLQITPVAGCGEITVYCGALAGAGLGFLWFNAYPAQVFMGDVGSLSMGASLGTVAVITKQEILLALVGGLFVIEALSVIFQVGFFKMTKGRRIFRMAPIHHHFELKGWPEPKVIVRFWIIAIALALISMSTLKLR